MHHMLEKILCKQALQLLNFYRRGALESALGSLNLCSSESAVLLIEDLLKKSDRSQ